MIFLTVFIFRIFIIPDAVAFFPMPPGEIAISYNLHTIVFGSFLSATKYIRIGDFFLLGQTATLTLK